MTLIKLIKSITKKEWQFVIFLCLLVIILTTLPLIYGWWGAKSDEEFTGVHFTVLTDWFVYYSHMEQVRQGHYLFKDLFTSEPHWPTLNIFWLSVGLFAKIFSLSNILAFNIARILLIPFFYFIAYLFLALNFYEIKNRKLGLLLLSFSSGCGTLLIDRLVRFPNNFTNGQLNWPMDLWVPEMNTYLTLYYSPHFIASLILIIFIFLLTSLFAENKKIIYALPAGLSSLVLFAFHPFHVLTIFVVIACYFATLIFLARKIIWSYVIYYSLIITLSLPAIFYYFYFLQNDEVLRQKYAQNLCLTTPFWLTIFSWGLLLVGGVYTLSIFLRKNNQILKNNLSLIFVAVWAIVQFCLLFAPVLFQRRLTEGLHYPLVVLTVIALVEIWQRISQQNNKFKKIIFSQRYLVLMFIIFLLTASNLFAVAADLYMYYSRKEFVYVNKENISAMEYLKNINDGQVVLNTAEKIVNIIPAYSGQTIYVGHGVETLSFFGKQNEVEWFFQDNRDQNIELEFLNKRNIGYIYYSDLEKELGRYNPEIKPYLELIYSNSKVKIFKLK